MDVEDLEWVGVEKVLNARDIGGRNLVRLIVLLHRLLSAQHLRQTRRKRRHLGHAPRRNS